MPGLSPNIVARAVVQFVVRDQQLRKSMGDVTKALDSFSARMALTGVGLTALGMTVSSFFDRILDPIVAGTKGALEFEHRLNEITTIMDTKGVKATQLFRRELMEISRLYGVELIDATKALREAISAGIPDFQAPDVLRASAKLARVSVVDLATAMDIVRTTVNAYHIDLRNGVKDIGGYTSTTDKLNKIIDILFTTIDFATFEMDKFAETFGAVAPNAKVAGIALEETTAALSALSRNGLNANQATASLSRMLDSFLKPTDRAQKLVEELSRKMGLTGDQAVELSQDFLRENGLLGAMQKLSVLVGDNTGLLAQIFTRIQGFRGAANLTTDDLQNFIKAFDDIKASTGGLNRQFALMQDATMKLEQVQAQWQSLLVNIGRSNIPILAGAVSWLIPKLNEMNKAFEEAPEHMSKWSAIVSVVALVGKALGEFSSNVGLLLLGLSFFGPFIKANFIPALTALSKVFTVPLKLALTAAVSSLLSFIQIMKVAPILVLEFANYTKALASALIVQALNLTKLTSVTVFYNSMLYEGSAATIALTKAIGLLKIAATSLLTIGLVASIVAWIVATYKWRQAVFDMERSVGRLNIQIEGLAKRTGAIADGEIREMIARLEELNQKATETAYKLAMVEAEPELFRTLAKMAAHIFKFGSQMGEYTTIVPLADLILGTDFTSKFDEFQVAMDKIIELEGTAEERAKKAFESIEKERAELTNSLIDSINDYIDKMEDATEREIQAQKEVSNAYIMKTEDIQRGVTLNIALMQKELDAARLSTIRALVSGTLKKTDFMDPVSVKRLLDSMATAKDAELSYESRLLALERQRAFLVAQIGAVSNNPQLVAQLQTQITAIDIQLEGAQSALQIYRESISDIGSILNREILANADAQVIYRKNAIDQMISMERNFFDTGKGYLRDWGKLWQEANIELGKGDTKRYRELQGEIASTWDAAQKYLSGSYTLRKQVIGLEDEYYQEVLPQNLKEFKDYIAVQDGGYKGLAESGMDAMKSIKEAMEKELLGGAKDVQPKMIQTLTEISEEQEYLFKTNMWSLGYAGGKAFLTGMNEAAGISPNLLDLSGLGSKYKLPSYDLPAHAKGTAGHKGGVALVGEEGPEIVNLPKGTAVLNAKDTKRLQNRVPSLRNLPAYASGTESMDDYMAYIKSYYDMQALFDVRYMNAVYGQSKGSKLTPYDMQATADVRYMNAVYGQGAHKAGTPYQGLGGTPVSRPQKGASAASQQGTFTSTPYIMSLQEAIGEIEGGPEFASNYNQFVQLDAAIRNALGPVQYSQMMSTFTGRMRTTGIKDTRLKQAIEYRNELLGKMSGYENAGQVLSLMNEMMMAQRYQQMMAQQQATMSPYGGKRTLTGIGGYGYAVPSAQWKGSPMGIGQTNAMFGAQADQASGKYYISGSYVQGEDAYKYISSFVGNPLAVIDRYFKGRRVSGTTKQAINRARSSFSTMVALANAAGYQWDKIPIYESYARSLDGIIDPESISFRQKPDKMSVRDARAFVLARDRMWQSMGMLDLVIKGMRKRGEIKGSFAAGGTVGANGPVLVGENGEELILLPSNHSGLQNGNRIPTRVGTSMELPLEAIPWTPMGVDKSSREKFKMMANFVNSLATVAQKEVDRYKSRGAVDWFLQQGLLTSSGSLVESKSKGAFGDYAYSGRASDSTTLSGIGLLWVLNKVKWELHKLGKYKIPVRKQGGAYFPYEGRAIPPPDYFRRIREYTQPERSTQPIAGGSLLGGSGVQVRGIGRTVGPEPEERPTSPFIGTGPLGGGGEPLVPSGKLSTDDEIPIEGLPTEKGIAGVGPQYGPPGPGNWYTPDLNDPWWNETPERQRKKEAILAQQRIEAGEGTEADYNNYVNILGEGIGHQPTLSNLAGMVVRFAGNAAQRILSFKKWTKGKLAHYIYKTLREQFGDKRSATWNRFFALAGGVTTGEESRGMQYLGLGGSAHALAAVGGSIAGIGSSASGAGISMGAAPAPIGGGGSSSSSFSTAFNVGNVRSDHDIERIATRAVQEISRFKRRI